MKEWLNVCSGLTTDTEIHDLMVEGYIPTLGKTKKIPVGRLESNKGSGWVLTIFSMDSKCVFLLPQVDLDKVKVIAESMCRTYHVERLERHKLVSQELKKGENTGYG